LIVRSTVRTDRAFYPKTGDIVEPLKQQSGEITGKKSVPDFLPVDSDEKAFSELPDAMA